MCSTFSTVGSEVRIFCAVDSDGPHERNVSKVKIKVSQMCFNPRVKAAQLQRSSVRVCRDSVSPLTVPYGVRLYSLVPGLLSLNTAAGVYRDLSLNCQRHLVFVE